MSDLFYPLLTLTLVFASAFAMYLPLCALLREKNISLNYAIPFSISAEIVLGYIFYSTDKTSLFPIYYLGFVLIVNIWAICKLWPIRIKMTHTNFASAFFLLFISAAFIYTRYYDSFKFIGPGGSDTFNHILYVKDLFTKGYLTNGYYAPGFHLFFMPIAKVVPFAFLYRFAGPGLGIVIATSFLLLMKDHLKNKILIFFLIALLTLPVYNQLTLQTIYFFPSALTFIFFPAIIILMSDTNVRHQRKSLFLIAMILLALALSVPYFYVSLIPASILFVLVVIIFKNRFEKKYFLYLLKVNVVLFLGFLASFGHVYLQSSVLNRYYGFPGIVTIEAPPQSVGSGASTTDVGIDDLAALGKVSTNDQIINKFHLPAFINNNRFLKPMFGSGYDLIRIKYLRSPATPLGLGAYIWIGLSVLLIFYSLSKKLFIKKNSSLLLIAATFSLVFGVSTQTGLLEMSAYHGRSGWYLMMLSLMCIVLFADQVYTKKMQRSFLIISLLSAIAGLVFPPKFIRSYNDQEFGVVSQIVNRYHGSDIRIIADNLQLGIIADNIYCLELNASNLQRENSVLILRKTANSHANNEQQKEAQDLLITNDSFKNFHLFYQDTDIKVYTNIRGI